MIRKYKFIWIIAASTIIGGSFLACEDVDEKNNVVDFVNYQATNSQNVDDGAVQKNINKESIEKSIIKKEKENLPNKILIDVPFTAQAPFQRWDAYHEEACEEASLIMLKFYLNKQELTPKIAEAEIQKMITFEIEKQGDYMDSSAEQIVALARDFYGIGNLKIVYDFPKEDLQKYLAQGRPIIVPAAGRLLGNPNFKAPGPLYHNLVLIGFEGQTIITNDPGTRKGENYRYDIDILYKAIHDFPGNLKDIEKGRKAMIIIE